MSHAGKPRTRIGLALSSLLIIGCEDSSTPAPPEIRYEILPLAAVTTHPIHSDSLSWIPSAPRDSIVQLFRVPRGEQELSDQIARGIWTAATDSTGKRHLAGMQFANASGSNRYRQWTPFSGDLARFTQANGFPEELAFAFRVPTGQIVDIDYKVNYSSWHPLARGRDFGWLGFDSLAFQGTTVETRPGSTVGLLGLSLPVEGKNFLLEGANQIGLRIRVGDQVVLERAFQIDYRLVGATLFETDASDSAPDTSQAIFYRTRPWPATTVRTTYLHIQPSCPLDSLEIRIVSRDTSPRTFENLPILRRMTTCAELVSDGWCYQDSGRISRIRIRLTGSEFEPYRPNAYGWVYRAVEIRAVMVLDRNLPQVSPYLDATLPIYLSP